MDYHNKRAHGIALLREYARELAAEGGNTRAAYAELKSAADALLSEFRREFDTPGTRYWEHYPSEQIFSTEAGERIPKNVACDCVELARHEFLSRQHIHFGYEEDAL